jgi:hypothetical protein
MVSNLNKEEQKLEIKIVEFSKRVSSILSEKFFHHHLLNYIIRGCGHVLM